MERAKRKIRTGVVISDKMDKTRVVKVVRVFTHPLYKKVIQKEIKLKVHDPENASRTGNKVVMVETRPLSKDKRWRLEKIIG